MGRGGSNTCTEVVVNKIRHALSVLDKTMPGLLNRIDLYFVIRYSKPFINMLVEDPALAIDELLNIYGGDSDSARFILYMILKIIFAGNTYLVDKALKSLQEGKYSEFVNMICGR